MALGGPLRRAFGVITRTGLHARAEGVIQGKHEVVAGLQCVRQDGPGRAGLAESGGHDQGVAPARLAPGRNEKASASGLRAAGLEAGDPVLAEQRVGVADHARHRNDGRGLGRDRGQRGHSHRRQAEAHLIGRSADGGRVQAGRVGVAGVGHAQAAGGGVHPRYERSLAAGVPSREYPGHVVGRRQQQRLERLALGDRLPGDDGHQRVARASLRRVRARLRRLDGDIRTRPASVQWMIQQDHVRGHDLGDAGDGHLPGRARAVRHAGAADVSGRAPVRRPRDHAKPILAWRGCPGSRRDRSVGRCLQLSRGAASQAGERGKQRQ
jgi:hypothetical protein